MSFYKFDKSDVLRNSLLAYPEYNFFIYEQNRYINNNNVVSGAYSASITESPAGYVNLYELNINKDFSKESIYPFVLNNKRNHYFRLSSLSSASQASLESGAVVTGSYPLTSSISYYHFPSALVSKPRLKAIKNTTNFYTNISPHYAYSSTVLGRDYDDVAASMITIPAIISGGGLKKGSVSLKYYVSGALQAELVDKRENGELIQVSGVIANNDEKIAGTVLYNEGLILLTGSWDLNTSHTENYGQGTDQPKWIYFGSSISGSVATPSSSYDLTFKATEKIPNISMMARANRGQLNFSNNPSFIVSSSANSPSTGSLGYFERDDRQVKNIVSASYAGASGSFEKITYITKIGIYDKYKNLIGVANLANPVRKREKDYYTFKIKADL